MADNIRGRLTKLGNVIIQMPDTARIIIEGWLVLGAKYLEGTGYDTIIEMYPQTTLTVNGKFELGIGGHITIFGGSLTVGSGHMNWHSRIAVKHDMMIGNDFLCGRNAYITDDDHHAIFDKNEEEKILNQVKYPLRIGNHVWLGESVRILKNVTIGDGAVIGAGSIVTKDIPPHSLAAGCPAQVIKKNISWS